MKQTPIIRIEKKVGAGIIKVAARHNLRDFEAGAIAPENIDTARSHHNVVLRGPANADEVAEAAKALLMQAEVAKLRKDAVRCVEVLVSLPARVEVDLMRFFEATTSWVQSYFSVPLLSAVVHLDEAAPHCHILMLPLIDGRMQGSDLVGGPAKLQATKDNFYQVVVQQFGMAIPLTPPRITGKEKRRVLDLAVHRLKALGIRDEVLLAVLLEPHANNPAALAQALGIAANKEPEKSFVSIMTKPCPEPRKSRMTKPNPIGFASPVKPERHRTLSCVGFGAPANSVLDSHLSGHQHNAANSRPVRIQVAEASTGRMERHTDEASVMREADMPAYWWDEVTGEFNPPAVQENKKANVQNAVNTALKQLVSQRDDGTEPPVSTAA